MTKMIYRPKTGETMTLDRRQVHKTTFKGVPCDALVIEESELSAYIESGWFADPNQMIEPEEKPEPKKRRRRKSANEKAASDDGSVNNS